MNDISIPTKELPDASFHDSVKEYLELEKSIRENFIGGLIKLGSLLEEQRAIYKPKGLWMEYLKAINKNYGSAYQLIKLYEYAKNNLKLLLNAEITTWDRLYSFLALPEVLRADFVEKLPDEEISTKEYKELADNIKAEEEDVTVEEEEVDLEELETQEKITFDDLLKNSVMKDSPFMAKELVKEFKGIGYSELTENSVAFAEGYVDLVKCFKNLNPVNYKSLSKPEKTFWKKILVGMKQQIIDLEKIMK